MEQKLRYRPPKSNIRFGLNCIGAGVVLILLVYLLPPFGFKFYMAILGGLLFLGGVGALLAQLEYTHPSFVVLDTFEIKIPQGIKTSHPVTLSLRCIRSYEVDSFGNIKIKYTEEELLDENSMIVKYLGQKEIKYEKYTIEKDWLTPEDYETVKSYFEQNVNQ